MAEYILMHKNIPVIKMELTEADGITKILDLYAPEHLPIGIPVKKNTVDKKALNMWWADRSIPSSRSGVQEALNEIGLADTKMLLVRSFGLSLSDQYWIKPDGTDLEWKRINFFDNAFSDDIGNVLFGLKKREGNFDFSSPDNTSDGCLENHRWKKMPSQGRKQSLPSAAIQRSNCIQYHGETGHPSHSLHDPVGR